MHACMVAYFMIRADDGERVWGTRKWRAKILMPTSLTNNQLSSASPPITKAWQQGSCGGPPTPHPPYYSTKTTKMGPLPPPLLHIMGAHEGTHEECTHPTDYYSTHKGAHMSGEHVCVHTPG